MQILPYVQTSVFVDDRYPFGGNQLATFWNKKENAQIKTETMQGIALEMNFSETTFIEESSMKNCTVKVRIFTPAKEIPFAGHPTLGTAFVLKHTKLVDSSITRLNLELGIGAIPVEYPSSDIVQMIQHGPKFLDEFSNRTAIAETVNLPVSTISTKYPMQYVSTGTPFLIIPLTSLKALQQAQPNGSLILQTLQNQLTKKIVLLSTETINHDSDVHVRMFAPDVGVIEDPATGSAAGPIGAYIEQYNLLQRDTKGEPVFIEQGYELRRPSQLIAKVIGKKEAEKVLVSGKVKLIAEGSFYVN